MARVTKARAERSRAGVQPRFAAYSRMGRSLQRQGLLVMRRDPRIDSGAKHFWRFLALAKKPLRFCCLRCPFGGHLERSDAQGFKLLLSAMRPEPAYYAATAVATRG
jgi:hypothetical protein